MIIVFDANGQLCNRFWSWVEPIAEAIEKHKKIIILQWDTQIRYYDNLRERTEYIRYPLYSPTLFRNWGGEKEWQAKIHHWLSGRIFGRLLSTKLLHSFGFRNGWKMRCDSVYFPNHKDEIRKIFQPNQDIKDDVERIFANTEMDNILKVGIHIRRGDYKSFVGGRFCFDDCVYARIMDEISSIYSEKHVVFYVSSNEPVSSVLSSKYEIIQKGASFNAAHDLYALSLCDRIVGPISTFSRWAAFMGNVPIAFLLDKNQSITTDEDFDRLVDYHHFSNGKAIPSLTKIHNDFIGWKPTHF